ncbi:MAG: hypothetical protein ABW042_06675 [Phenylobacterium sp.]
MGGVGGVGGIGGGNINIDVDGGWGWGGWVDYPFLAGAAFAWTTAAVFGSMYYALPPGCPPYAWGGYSYYHCGGVYYEPRYEGDTVVYVTVADPSGGKGPTPSGAAGPDTTAPRPSASPN